MGDVLNTREMVSVQSLSAATRFFDELSQIAPVHVILGYSSLFCFFLRYSLCEGKGGKEMNSTTNLALFFNP
jgi:hypothetical protein